jgi:hypothetical protein
MGVSDELVTRLERAEARIEDLEGEIRFLRGLLANPSISSTQKSVLWAVRDLVGRTCREAERFVEIDVRELGKLAGLSRFTVGKQLVELAEMGAIARRERLDVAIGKFGRKTFRKRISVALTIWTDRPGDLRPLVERNHGGKREKRCPNCESTDLVLSKSLWCACCKRELGSTMELVNKDGRTFDEFVEDVLRRDQERGYQAP